MMNDNEFEAKENEIYPKDKILIEPQHIKPRSQPRWDKLIPFFKKKKKQKTKRFFKSKLC